MKRSEEKRKTNWRILAYITSESTQGTKVAWGLFSLPLLHAPPSGNFRSARCEVNAYAALNRVAFLDLTKGVPKVVQLFQSCPRTFQRLPMVANQMQQDRYFSPVNPGFIYAWLYAVCSPSRKVTHGDGTAVQASTLLCFGWRIQATRINKPQRLYLTVVLERKNVLKK